MTTSPPCAPQTSADGILYTAMNPNVSMTSYTCFAYTWIATGSSATLSFFFRHDPSNWLLDDVSVHHGLTQVLNNGGFESGNTVWTRTGLCAFSTGSITWSLVLARTGFYYYTSPCRNYGDTLSQTFPTVAGDNYVIRFWLANAACCATTVMANITVT